MILKAGKSRCTWSCIHIAILNWIKMIMLIWIQLKGKDVIKCSGKVQNHLFYEQTQRAIFGEIVSCSFTCQFSFKYSVTYVLNLVGAWHENFEKLILLKLTDKVSFHLCYPQWKKCKLVSRLEVIVENRAYVIYCFI